MALSRTGVIDRGTAVNGSMLSGKLVRLLPPAGSAAMIRMVMLVAGRNLEVVIVNTRLLPVPPMAKLVDARMAGRLFAVSAICSETVSASTTWKGTTNGTLGKAI